MHVPGVQTDRDAGAYWVLNIWISLVDLQHLTPCGCHPYRQFSLDDASQALLCITAVLEVMGTMPPVQIPRVGLMESCRPQGFPGML